MRRPVVLDASVGVKWVKRESGSEEARRLSAEHARGDIHIVVPSIFVTEVLDVARRRLGGRVALAEWRSWQRAGLVIAPLDDTLVESALDIAADSGCTLYDAMAPALALRIGAPLYSADRKAHGEIEGAVIIE